jgi:hypothetical protein
MIAEDQSLIYTLTVPCAPDSLAVLEGLTETFLGASSHLPSDIALVLRLSVAEACRHALSQQAPPGRLNLVTMSFWKIGASGAFDFALEIEDPGRGIEVNGVLPPYPPEHVKTSSIIARVLGQGVVAHVEDPHHLRLSVMELSGDDEESTRRKPTHEKGEKGLGLLALASCWQSVRVTYDEAKGSRLRLEKPRLVV